MTRPHALGAQLRAVHRKLRNAIDLARAGLDSGDPINLADTDLQVYCVGFCLALNEHHGSEDTALFPLIEQIRPDLRPVLDRLTSDHSVLAHLIRTFDAALRSGADPDRLVEHLDSIEAVMLTHFTYEEKELAPLLDDVGAPGAPTTMLGSLAT